MKAVAYKKSLPIEHPESLIDIVVDDPVAFGRDLLVEVRAIAANPVDTKVRLRQNPPAGEWRILGWDAAGVVRAVGPEVTLFKPGDRVWYAGDINRPGTNSELHLVDERLVGHMPNRLDFIAAAALPLTSITAWELLFDRFGLVPGKKPSQESLLIIGAGGGVGSIMTQLARRLTSLKVIGTASRTATREWVKAMGAHQVIDHSKPLSEELARIGHPQVTHVASLTRTDIHYTEIVELIAPQGKFGLIDDPGPLDISLLKAKSVSLHWELMFTRSRFQTPDMIGQHRLLNEVAALIDDGLLCTTLTETLSPINATNLKKAHQILESGTSRGKIVLAGFEPAHCEPANGA